MSSTTSVSLATLVPYPDGNSLNIVDVLAVKSVVALADEQSSLPQSLFIGASKDIQIQALGNTTIVLGSTNTLAIKDSSSVDSLVINSDVSTTTIASSSKDLVIGTTDDATFHVSIGSSTISQSSNFQVVDTTMTAGFKFTNNLYVSGTNTIEQGLSVGGNVICNSNVFAHNYNLFRYQNPVESVNEATLTGYTLSINDNDQLEILKHTSFSNNSSMTKRVAVFGTNRLYSNDTSELPTNMFSDLSEGMISGGTPISQGSSGGEAFIADGHVSLSKIDRTTVGVFDISPINNNAIYYSTGFIGIGQSASNPQYTLDIHGDLNVSGYITNYSDARLKSDVHVINNALDKLKQVSGYTFTMKNDEKVGRKHAGVIAQEMQQVLPEVVDVDSSGILSVAYGNIAAILIEGIKELSQQVEGIKNHIGYK